jgi:hypothetical protein
MELTDISAVTYDYLVVWLLLLVFEQMIMLVGLHVTDIVLSWKLSSNCIAY